MSTHNRDRSHLEVIEGKADPHKRIHPASGNETPAETMARHALEERARQQGKAALSEVVERAEDDANLDDNEDSEKE